MVPNHINAPTSTRPTHQHGHLHVVTTLSTAPLPPPPQMRFSKAYPFPLTQVITSPLVYQGYDHCYLSSLYITSTVLLTIESFSSANKHPAKSNKNSSIAPTSTTSYNIPFLYSPLLSKSSKVVHTL